MKIKDKKGFTLIELIVTMAIISLLVLLAAPRLLGYTDKAVVAELTTNARAIQDASERYHLDEDDWPRLTDEPYSSEEIEAFAEKIYGITGEEVNLDPNGNYYDIDFDKLESYVSVPGDKANYIIQNPVGKVYALQGLTPSRFERLPEGYHDSDEPIQSEKPEKEENFDEFVASNDEFEWINHNGAGGYEVNGVTGFYRYIGEKTTVAIPHEIEGHSLTSYYRMFENTNVEKVISTNSNIENMGLMFSRVNSNELDLSTFDTSNVTNMANMFTHTEFEQLDLSTFDTSNVTSMERMFSDSDIGKLNLLSFDTSNVTNMRNMFSDSGTRELDLSSFEISENTNVNTIFNRARARTGLARTNVEAGILNDTDRKPARFLIGLKENNDYTWINHRGAGGYEVNGVTGFYKYIGAETTVTIPHEIEGHSLTSYYRMFENTNVEKVISTNSNIEDMGLMFSRVNSNELDLSTFDTSNVINMASMFTHTEFEQLDLSTFDTSNVTSMERMFSDSDIEELNLLSFDTSNVTNMRNMFSDSGTRELDLSSFEISENTNVNTMFNRAGARIGFAKTNVEAGILNATDRKPARFLIGLKENNDYTWINYRGVGGYEVNGVTGFYKYIGAETTVTIPHEIEGHSLTSYYRMFENTNVEKVISTNSNIENMGLMFSRVNSNELDLSTFDTSNVTNMANMFTHTEFEQLDLSTFDTSNVTSMERMFSDSDIGKLNLLSFDTSNVTNMRNMFSDSGTRELDLSSFEISENTNVNTMFNRAGARIGFAKTNVEVEILNATDRKPSRLIFEVK